MNILTVFISIQFRFYELFICSKTSSITEAIVLYVACGIINGSTFYDDLKIDHSEKNLVLIML